MKITYDKANKMLNIQFKEEPSTESAEIEPGVVIDYNSKNEVIGIELDVSISNIDLSKISFENLGNVS